ncbi:MAG: hypothetical protein AB7S26_13145 [Sandaracinaceae bacterium]
MPAKPTPKRSKSSSNEREALAPLVIDTWDDVLDAFLRETRPRSPERIRAALEVAIGMPGSRGDLLRGGWILRAPIRIYEEYVHGFGPARTFELLERFFGWMHRRGELTDWQRDVLYTEIDESRSAHFLTPRRSERVKELRIGTLGWEELLARFVDEHPTSIDLEGARRIERILKAELEARLGPCQTPPLGSLDTSAMLAEVIEGAANIDLPKVAATLTTMATFLRWLADVGELEPKRARLLAEELARGALMIPSLARALPTAGDRDARGRATVS